MDTVKSAGNSPFLNRHDQLIYPIHGQEEQEHEQSKREEFPQPEFDRLVLSKATKETLKSIDTQYSQLLKNYPEYQDRLMGQQKGKSLDAQHQAISYLTRAKAFLNSPNVRYMLQRSPHFAAFYQKVKHLTTESERALHETHTSVQTAAAPTYHNLLR